MRVALIDYTSPGSACRAAIRDLLRGPDVICSMPLESRMQNRASRTGFVVLCASELAAVRLGSRIQALKVEGVRIQEFPIPETEAIDRPIVILGAPRAGTTLLFESLSQIQGVWTVGRESQPIIDHTPQLRALEGADSHRLTRYHASPAAIRSIRSGFIAALRDRDNRLYVEALAEGQNPNIRFLEKTPRNSLRIPFLQEVFGDPRFIFIHRDATTNVASLIDGWAAGRFSAYHVDGRRWSFLLPPDWREMAQRPIEEIAAFQWRSVNECILEDLGNVPSGSWRAVSYNDLVRRPRETLLRLCDFIGLQPDAHFEKILSEPLRLSSSSLTPPDPEKWRRHSAALEKLLPSLNDTSLRLAASGSDSPAPP